MPAQLRLAVLGAAVLAAGCGESARLTVDQTTGTDPELVEPNTTLIPTLNFADARGWQPDQAPTAASGLTVTRFAEGLDHPRWIYVLPNNDVLVAEANAPAGTGTGGIRGFIEGYFKKKAGVSGVSADRITLLRDADADGLVEERAAFLTGLASPFGMALVGEHLYVANSGSLVRFPYVEGTTRITATPDTVALLPGGNTRHWTRSLLASPDGTKLYVGVGSATDVAEQGLEAEVGRAAIWEVDVASDATRLFGTGLRNPVGMVWGPNGRLWTAVNERDELGSDLVPDYLTAVADGDFYGWPYSYFGDIVDPRVEPQRPDLVATALVPDYALGAHTASLGLAWDDGAHLGLGPGMLVGQHGSWNRRPKSGYKVVMVPFVDGEPSGTPVDVLTGFLSDDQDEAYGRPVGVVFDASGAMLVADDIGNVIWRVTRSGR